MSGYNLATPVTKRRVRAQEHVNCEAADLRARLAAAEALRDEALEALRNVTNPNDTIQRCQRLRAPEDAEVFRLCLEWGYGAVMGSAARQWANKDPQGAHTSGPCRVFLEKAQTLLATDAAQAVLARREMESINQPKVIEVLAAYAHQAWASWTEWMLAKWDETHANGETFPDRWRRQIATPYSALTEGEKDSDREEAKKMIAVFTVALATDAAQEVER